MSFSYDFDPSQSTKPLNVASRSAAETALKGMLRIASRGMLGTTPKAVILYENGVEVWRWTQLDRSKSVFLAFLMRDGETEPLESKEMTSEIREDAEREALRWGREAVSVGGVNAQISLYLKQGTEAKKLQAWTDF